jgi:hypothetical protein
MITLPTVTLIQIDTTPNRDRAERAMRKCQEQIVFAESKLLTANEIPHVNSYEAYNQFVVTELHKHFDTPHCLLIQWDGYVINPLAWRDEYLNYDYIGAPWPDNVQGNGGFSLRSKKLCEVGDGFIATNYAPEDVFVCRNFRSYYEDGGCAFAPVNIADMFSFEKSAGREYYGGQLGFHGTHSTEVIPKHLL